MIRILAIFGSILISIQAVGQQFPIFKKKGDSLQYAKIISLYQYRLTDSVKINFDSLEHKMDLLRKKALGWGNVYRSNKNFVAYTDLKSGKVNPNTITHLSISELKADHIPKEILSCKNLEALELVNTQINELQEELNSLAKLSSIYLYNNVPSKRLILRKNNTVNYLRIAGHYPEKLPRSYKNFTSLDSLNLNRSMSTRIPDISKNKQLIILYAVNNNITLRRYKKNSTLEHLDLRMNKVVKIPNSISQKYKSLKALSFNSNPVKKVKPGLGKLTQLIYLSLYGNMLPKIPDPVYKLKNLQVIDLFNNQIEEISPEIGNLQQLKILYLANNKLYSMPKEIGLLTNLEEVYVYNNRMDTLPASMDNLKKLRVLWVNDNFFHTIPPVTWHVKKMDYLDASQNFIKHIPDELAQTKLSTLILSSSLMQKEKENPELFEKLRKQGTKIIYHSSVNDEPVDEDSQY